MTTFNPKIKLDGFTSTEPLIKFTQNYEWTSSNFCLHVDNGYTNLNGLIINGFDNNDTFKTSNNNYNISFNVTGNSNIIFKTNNTERLIISNSGNVGIGATTSTYKLNVNGTINSTLLYKSGVELDNIYLLIRNNYWLLKTTVTSLPSSQGPVTTTSKILYTDPSSNIDKIGIGNTEPLGYLHLGSATKQLCDANIILSKNYTTEINRNFKIGYDDNYNFSFGDYGIYSEQQWKKQFYINSAAPENSLLINSSGNIGIGTTNIGSFKLNVNGSINASSFTGNGANIINVNYNNLTERPNLKNLNNWDIVNNRIYNNPSFTNILIGYTIDTSPNTESDTQTYKLAVNGNIYSRNGFYINGENTDIRYLSKTDANNNYVSKTVFNSSNILIVDYNINTFYIKLLEEHKTKPLLLGTLGENSTNPLILLDAYGIIKSSKFMGDGSGINNINFSNINLDTIPNYLTTSRAVELYYNKTYFNDTYSNIILNSVKERYLELSVKTALEERIDALFNSTIDKTGIAESINSLIAENKLFIYHSNLIQLPYNNSYNNDLNTHNFGFNTSPSLTEIIKINGDLKATNIKATGNIYENNTLLNDTYISSNSYHKNISNYDLIIDRIKSQLTPEKTYPPLISPLLFNNSYSCIISNASYGNGSYKIQSSTNLMILHINGNTNLEYEKAPASNLFNYDSLSDSWSTGNSYIYNGNPAQFNSTTLGLQNILYTNINNILYFGHWIILYYSEKIVASKIDIIIKTSLINNAPKKITLIGTNVDNIDITFNFLQTYSGQQANEGIWNKLLDNYIIPSYTTVDDTNSIASINIINNSSSFKNYKLIVTEIVENTANKPLQIQQIKLYAFENKKEWTHSGTNIYSLSNVSIGTINNLSPYLLNVNGYIYSSSNIYANSNIGIGNTNPLANLHIASPNIISDGTLIISKKNNINSRNFKFGYDENFNFSFGDFNDTTNIWSNQFYINSNAPGNSLMINTFGNIGIGTSNTSLNQKLIVNGNSTIDGYLYVNSNIKEGADYLHDIYVKLENLSNLSINNLNLKKKFGYTCATSGPAIEYNSTNYYKFDIDLTLNTKYLVNTIATNSVCYRSFNIKCFLTNCSFETFNDGVPNILQYDIYMSSNPIPPFCDPPIAPAKTNLNICAIGTPENYKLDNILPSYISLLRNDEPIYMFNYLSITSPHSNLHVSYIIEDYLS